MEDLLFYKYDWLAFKEGEKKRMNKDIATRNGTELLNTSTDDLAAEYMKKYKIDVPVINRDNITSAPREVQIDVMDGGYHLSGTSHVTGAAVYVKIPFKGDENLFQIKPTSWTLNPPRATISSGVLSLTHPIMGMTKEQVQSEIDKILAKIEKYLGWLNKDATALNNTLMEQAKDQIESRKQNLISNSDLVAGLDFKKRPEE